MSVYGGLPPCVLVLTLAFLGGCATDAQRPSDSLLRSGAIERQCGPPSTPLQPGLAALSHNPSGAGVSRYRDLPVPSGFSPRALKTAEIIGALPALAQLPALEGDTSRSEDSQTIRLLQAQQQLSDRILLGFLDVARTAAEADCEEERADQLADRLQEARDKRVRSQTLIAIVGDAMIGIVAGGLSLALEGTASAAAAILGGSVATGFGLAAFFDDTRYEFRHPRNILREVWEGPEQPSLIPSSVWRYLNRPLPSDPHGRSMRETLIARWREDGRLGEPGSETEQRRTALFFGEGGSYEIDDLRARASMLDLLEADVNLMSQDLEGLMQEVLAREAG